MERDKVVWVKRRVEDEEGAREVKEVDLVRLEEKGGEK